MGKFGRKIERKKPKKVNALQVSNALLSAVNADAMSKHRIIDKAATAIGNIISAYVLKKHFGFSRKQIAHYWAAYRRKCQATADNYDDAQARVPVEDRRGTSRESIVKYEIKAGKEFDKASLGWKDWAPMETEDADIIKKLNTPTTKNGLYNQLFHVACSKIAELVFNKREVIVISALHDFCGFGLKRIKRYVELSREYTWMQEGELNELIEWFKTCIHVSDWEKFKDLQPYWKLCLKPVNVVY